MRNKRKIQRVRKAQARPERIRMQKRSEAKRIARMIAPAWSIPPLYLIEWGSRMHRMYLAKRLEIAQELENCKKQLLILKSLEAD